MDIDASIRNRIETVLLDDARRYAELKQELGDQELPWMEPLARDRRLYERIVASCRHTLSEVNGLLEENIDFLSGFCRIIEGIKEKSDLEEMCMQVAGCALEDFHAEYCAIMIFEDATCGRERFCLEAVREGHSVTHVHSYQSLLGSSELERLVMRLVSDTPGECLSSPDVYRDARFAEVDWPSVVRAFACIPVVLCGKGVGALVLAHSIPSSFRDNHFRLLRILAGMIAHMHLLTSGHLNGGLPVTPVNGDQSDHFSVVLVSFEKSNGHGRGSPPDPAILRELRRVLSGALQPSEPILPHSETEFLALLPGTGADLVSGKVRTLRAAFSGWSAAQKDDRRKLRMNVGFSTCRPGDNLSRVLEVASAVMHPDADE